MGRTPLIESIQTQDINKLQEWLRNNSSPDALNKPISSVPHDTPLYMAILLGNIRIVQTLIEYGANPAQRDKLGRTILHHAFDHIGKSNIRDIIKLLVVTNHGIINIADDRGYTGVHMAIYSGDISLVYHFIHLGADLSVMTNNGEGIVYFSITHGNYDIANLLIEQGAEIDFFAYCRLGNLNVVKEMIRNEPHIINSTLVDGTSPLHIAASCGNVDMIRLLLDNGADVNTEDKEGETALFKVEKIETASTLIEAGARINHKEQDGQTVIHRINKVDIIEYLLKKGANLHEEDNFGDTPLRIAIVNRSEDLVRTFLIQGANPSPLFVPIQVCDDSGQIDYSFSANEIRKLLMESGYNEDEVQNLFNRYDSKGKLY